jgi:hypothetical protein
VATTVLSRPPDKSYPRLREIRAEVLPQDKAAIVEQLKADGRPWP